MRERGMCAWQQGRGNGVLGGVCGRWQGGGGAAGGGLEGGQRADRRAA